ncbi:MAG TPA: hypothetical protein VFK30_07235, partial [Anaerolineae bacterium]|nr:hypothetical protein [Anaerolineae bacterium]
MKRTTPPKKATARSKGSAKPKAGRKTIVKRVKAVIDPRVIELQTQANRAMAKGRLDLAIDLLTQALAIGQLPFEIEYDLLKQRGLCNSYVGHNAASMADAQAMFRLAKQQGDVSRQAAALLPWVDAARNAGAAFIREIVKLATRLERQSSDPHVQADCLFVLAFGSWVDNQLPQAAQQIEDAVRFYRESGNRSAEAYGLQNVSGIYRFMGKADEARQAAQAALSLYRAFGDR